MGSKGRLKHLRTQIKVSFEKPKPTKDTIFYLSIFCYPQLNIPGCFQFVTITKKAAMDIVEEVHLRHGGEFLGVIYLSLEVDLLPSP